MRRQLVIQVLVLVLVLAVTLTVGWPALAGKGQGAEGTDYGTGLTGNKTIAVAELLADPAAHVGRTIRVEGVVTDVCEMAGCWMTLAPADEQADELRIKVDDGVIVFPVSARGKRAIAEGKLSRIEMTLDQTVAYQQHLAEEQGEPFDPASVTEPATYYRVEATGARIY